MSGNGQEPLPRQWTKDELRANFICELDLRDREWFGGSAPTASVHAPRARSPSSSVTTRTGRRRPPRSYRPDFNNVSTEILSGTNGLVPTNHRAAQRAAR